MFLIASVTVMAPLGGSILYQLIPNAPMEAIAKTMTKDICILICLILVIVSLLLFKISNYTSKNWNEYNNRYGN